ncbi:MAG TPA: helix-turn-helix domain-containing protein, partial [Marmoricola sp.]|nr:helix-turn-helix domain-containing protein [Marmoricola sp.]
MTARADEIDDEEQLLTVDELAAATGMTVRTTRYYAGLGLLPPPERRGRMAYYSTQHRARLELIRALQDHGFTLSAIKGYVDRIPDDATPSDVA